MSQNRQCAAAGRLPGVVAAGLVILGSAALGWWVMADGDSRPAGAVPAGLPPTTPDEPPAADRAPLRIAIGSMISPKNTYDVYDELLNRVGHRLGRPVRFVQRKTYQEVNDLVERREVDVALVSSGAYVTGHDKFGMELLVAPVAHGQTVYHSYILVHRDSPVRSFEELRGRTFAFTDPYSNSGCLVPRYLLSCRGETPQSFFGDTFYSHSHDNSIKAVADGTATAAAVDSLIYEYAATLEPAMVARTRVLLKSPPYGINPIVVHPAMPAAEKAELRQVFVSLSEDDVARSQLRRLLIDRFAPVEDRLYDSVREMSRRLAESGEGPRR
jgi:phosphonate transport system substrate-binding protein